MQRLRAERSGKIWLRLYDDEGAHLDPTGNAITVTIRDAGGDSVSTGAATRHGAGHYYYTVPVAVTNVLGLYDVEWAYTVSAVASKTRTQFKVVGGYTFEIAELRAYDASLADENIYTNERLREARDTAEERLEEAAGVSFVQQCRLLVASGNDRERLVLPDTEVYELVSVSVDADVDGDYENDDADIEILEGGILRRIDGTIWVIGSNNYLIEYEHGFKSVPAPVKRAALMLAFEALVPSALPARATAQSTDLGEFRVSVANVDAGRYTGIPEVDAVIAQFGRRSPAVG